MIPNHKGEIPVILLLLPFLLGIGFAINFSPAVQTFWLITVFMALCIAFIVLNLNYNRLNLYKYRWLGGALIIPILFLFGWIQVANYSETLSKGHFSKIQSQYLVVRINNEPVQKNGFIRFTADVKKCVNSNTKLGASGTVLISVKDSLASSLGYGDELLIPAKYLSVDPPFNPAEFNYKKYLAGKNIFYQQYLFPKQYVVLARNTGNTLVAHSLALRRQLVEKLRHNMRDTDAITVASTLILGYKAGLSSDVLRAYSDTGTVYVLTVSGAQVGIIYLILNFILGFLGRFKNGKLLKALIIISVIWYYALLTGCSIAVCRVAFMVSMVIIGKSFSRYINTLNIVAVSAFVLLCYNPMFLAEAGFQLSFLAVSGLILFQPLVYQWLSVENKWLDKLWQLCSVSIAIQLVISPLIVFYFHQFPVYFLISNLVVVIPAALMMYSGILFLLLPQIPEVSAALVWILEKTTIFMNKTLAIIEHSPWSNIDKIWISTPESLLLFMAIGGLFFFWYHKKIGALKYSLVCVFILCAGFSLQRIVQSQSATIAWLNLGKHKGIVFNNGNKAIVLTDLKSADKTYQYSVQPYLDSCGVNHAVLYDLDTDINTTWLKKKNGLVQFLNTRIFICNNLLETDKLPAKIKVNFIYFTGNPHGVTNIINRNFDYRMAVIDGSNSDHTVNELETKMHLDNINYKILKRNISLISVSN